jgi:hypothetical protein
MDSKSWPSDIALLDDYLSDPNLKLNIPWGFNIYRNDYSNDKAWQRMLHLIDETVRNGLEVNNAMDLYPRYKPVLVDNKETVEGATSHDIHHYFIA